MRLGDTLLLRLVACTLDVGDCFHRETTRFFFLPTRFFFPAAEFAKEADVLYSLCSHFLQGNEPVMTCVARLFLFS